MSCILYDRIFCDRILYDRIYLRSGRVAPGYSGECLEVVEKSACSG